MNPILAALQVAATVGGQIESLIAALSHHAQTPGPDGTAATAQDVLDAIARGHAAAAALDAQAADILARLAAEAGTSTSDAGGLPAVGSTT